MGFVTLNNVFSTTDSWSQCRLERPTPSSEQSGPPRPLRNLRWVWEFARRSWRPAWFCVLTGRKRTPSIHQSSKSDLGDCSALRKWRRCCWSLASSPISLVSSESYLLQVHLKANCCEDWRKSQIESIVRLTSARVRISSDVIFHFVQNLPRQLLPKGKQESKI